ncbi:TPA: hypothetical protein MBI04_003556 [Klebsiella pneumoniae]|nr:hypothetical protein [Klebsiella pneumoniae]
MYNFNGQLFDENLNPVGGTLTPGQVQQGGNTVLQLQDMKDMQVYQTTPEANLDSLYMKAKPDAAKALSGGLDIKPPSALRQMIDMAGGLLIGYFAARSGGASGTGALLVGLTAAASNHDSDQGLIDRAKIARKMFAQGGYTEDALYNFYRTGDDSGLKAETSSIAQDRRQGITEQGANERQDKTIDAQQQRQESQQKFQAQEQNQRLDAQKDIAQMRIDAQNSNLRKQLTQTAAGRVANQIMDNDKPMRDRYSQQYTGWTDAQNQLNIIKSAMQVLNDPDASQSEKDRAQAEIQGAIPSLASGVARGEAGGNRSLTPQEVKNFLPNLGLSSNLYNAATGKYNGGMSDAMVGAIQDQIAGNRQSIASSLNQMNTNEKIAIDKALNGDMTGGFTYTGANLPQSTDEFNPNADYSGQASTAPEGATIQIDGVTYKTVNGKWEKQ